MDGDGWNVEVDVEGIGYSLVLEVRWADETCTARKVTVRMFPEGRGEIVIDYLKLRELLAEVHGVLGRDGWLPPGVV